MCRRMWRVNSLAVAAGLSLAASSIGCASRLTGSSELKPIGADIPFDCRQTIAKQLADRADNTEASNSSVSTADFAAVIPEVVSSTILLATRSSRIDLSHRKFSVEDRRALVRAMLEEFGKSRICGANHSQLDFYLVADAIGVYAQTLGVEAEELFDVTSYGFPSGDPLTDIMIALAIEIGRADR